MKLWKKILFPLFPMFDCNIANKDVNKELKIIWNKLENYEPIADVQKFGIIDNVDAEYLLQNVRNNITSLQDKAKVTVFAVTIAFSLVGGISGYLFNLKEKLYVNDIFTISLLFCVIASCYYLITCGYYSLLTLNARLNYDFNADSFGYLKTIKGQTNRDIEKRYMLGEHYKLTSFSNIILNNYVVCSNNNLRNALISLGLFFTLICSSFVLSENQVQISEEQNEEKLANQNKLLEEIESNNQRIMIQFEDVNNINNNEIKRIKESLKIIDTKIEKILESENEHINENK